MIGSESSRPSSRNQTKTLLGIETFGLPRPMRTARSRNQTKTLLGIETNYSDWKLTREFRSRNQTKTLLGIETAYPNP